MLAAGRSSRMGQMKVLLPWLGDQPILAHILQQVAQVPLDRAPIVVLGHRRDEIEAMVDLSACHTVFNPEYAAGEMLSSLKAGLRALQPETEAALLVLGDQPFFDAAVARRVMDSGARERAAVTAPSYQMRRGHPILLLRRVADAILALPADASPRAAINTFAEETYYVVLDDPDGDLILIDVDTPDAYAAARQRAGLPALA